MVGLGGSHPHGEYETKVLDQSLAGLRVVQSGIPELAVNPARRGPLSQDGRLRVDWHRGIAGLACRGAAGHGRGRDLNGPRYPRNIRHGSNAPQSPADGTYPVSCQTIEWSRRGDGVTWSGVGQTRGGRKSRSSWDGPSPRAPCWAPNVR